MPDHWYDKLLVKLDQVYNEIIAIYDLDNLGAASDLQDHLNQNYTTYQYKNEFGLRTAITHRNEKPLLIFLPNKEQYLPYDIESRTETIEWSLADIFENLDINVLKDYSTNFLEEIYQRYRSHRFPPGTLGTDDTRELVNSWIVKESKYIEISDLGQKIRSFIEKDNPDWKVVAQSWGRLSYLRDRENIEVGEYSELDSLICQKFEQFILEHYKDLFFSIPLEEPVTINNVMKYLGYLEGEKKALICFDGMAFQEWYLLKDYLSNHGINRFREYPVYALLPTLTHTSRRALFCGEKNLESLSREDSGFKGYITANWKNGNSKAIKLYYNAKPEWNPEYQDYDYLGIIINIVDDGAHAEKYVDKSKRLMQKKISIAINESKIIDIFENLLDNGYRVFIASDHGTVWCYGNGYRADKYLVEDKARRALIYPNDILANDFMKDKNVLKYSKKDILGEKVTVFPKGREMFAKVGDSAISHGGIHIEEVIVPFAEVLK